MVSHTSANLVHSSTPSLYPNICSAKAARLHRGRVGPSDCPPALTSLTVDIRSMIKVQNSKVVTCERSRSDGGLPDSVCVSSREGRCGIRGCSSHGLGKVRVLARYDERFVESSTHQATLPTLALLSLDFSSTFTIRFFGQAARRRSRKPKIGSSNSPLSTIDVKVSQEPYFLPFAWPTKPCFFSLFFFLLQLFPRLATVCWGLDVGGWTDYQIRCFLGSWFSTFLSFFGFDVFRSIDFVFA